MLAYGVPADATDENCRRGESIAIEAMKTEVYNGRSRLLQIHFLATTVPCRLSEADGDQCSPRLPRYVRQSRLNTLGVEELPSRMARPIPR